jgi:hypothetical protein
MMYVYDAKARIGCGASHLVSWAFCESDGRVEVDVGEGGASRPL